MASFIRTLVVGAIFCLAAVDADGRSKAWQHDNRWVDSWTSMPQLVEPANLPSPPFNVTGSVFLDSTLRQTLHLSLPSTSLLRLRISNVFGVNNLPITSVTIALPHNDSAGVAAIQPNTLKTVTFSGSKNYTIPDGALAVSDPVDLPVKGQSMVTVSIYLEEGQSGNFITGHPGSRTTSWMTEGNQVAATNLTGSALASVDRWYFVSAVEVSAPRDAKAFVIVGDSITDGLGSTTNENNRWPDLVLARMQANRATSNIGVVNQAAGGNRVLHDGLGPNALGRIDRDVLAQSGLGYAMIFEGVNDIGTGATDAASQQVIGDRLIAAFMQIATRVHTFDVPMFASTITPFSAPGYNVTAQAYSNPEREKTRQRVNAFIRTSGVFDQVIDFDAMLRNETHPEQLQAALQRGDWLHPNSAGYQKIADGFPLGIFREW